MDISRANDRIRATVCIHDDQTHRKRARRRVDIPWILNIACIAIPKVPLPADNRLDRGADVGKYYAQGNATHDRHADIICNRWHDLYIIGELHEIAAARRARDSERHGIATRRSICMRGILKC